MKEAFTPRLQTFIPRKGSFIPRSQTFIPRKESFIPRWQTFIPRKETITPRSQTFIPRDKTFTPRWQTFIPRSQTFISTIYLCIKFWLQVTFLIKLNRNDSWFSKWSNLVISKISPPVFSVKILQ